MKTSLHNGFLFVEVNKHCVNPYINGYGDHLCYTGVGGIETVEIPQGDWSIHSVSDTMTEEQAAEIVGVKFSVTTDTTTNYYPNFLYPENSWETALESFPTLCQSLGMPIKNPCLHLGSEKPTKGEVEVSYDGGKNFDNHTEWTDKRTCMMAGIAGGYGYFGEGWATSRNGSIDVGLICDPPDFWVYTDEFAEYKIWESKLVKVVVLKPIK